MKNLFYLAFFLFSFCSSQESKINGISFVASNSLTSEKEIEPILHSNANWVTLMPFAFMKTINDTTLFYNSNRQWIGERKEGIEHSANQFKKNKISVMLKPQIWIPNGFTGHIKMNSEQEWISLEKNYEKFILLYAQIAEEQQIELLCIGTELNTFVINRPEYWHQLIVKIKALYKGKLTYAENWDTFETVSFFKNIDYIGIDAYFPLSKEKTPSISEIEQQWMQHKNKIENLAKELNKKVLFTEFGYQSIDYTTKEPWDFSQKKTLNLKAQSNALQALFNTFWKEDWFAGGFLWKWFDDYENVGGLEDTDYTVQNKPAFQIIQNEYKKMR
ncbi:glycoside hydrolase family 113 [Flavobacterium sp.]|uniref:glycoside hydrolase family 113 n=1 Tax=Flavobacterium sp. TaxID=239 RepID=UPI004047F3E5